MPRSYQQKRRITLAAEARLNTQAQRSARALSNRLADRYGLLENRLRQQWPRFIESRPVLAYQRRALADSIGSWWSFLDRATQSDLERILSGSVEAAIALAKRRFPGAREPQLKPSTYVDAAMEAIAAALGRAEQRMSITAATGVEQGLGFSRVARLLRALTQRTNTEASTISITTTYEANSDAVIGILQEEGIELLQWQTTGDDRVCAVCAARDLLVYRLDEIVLPAHMRCRCQALPVTLDELDDPELAAEMAAYRKSTLDALAEVGRKPNYGLTPSEKFQGRTETAKIIWTPEP